MSIISRQELVVNRKTVACPPSHTPTPPPLCSGHGEAVRDQLAGHVRQPHHHQHDRGAVRQWHAVRGPARDRPAPRWPLCRVHAREVGRPMWRGAGGCFCGRGEHGKSHNEPKVVERRSSMVPVVAHECRVIFSRTQRHCERSGAAMPPLLNAALGCINSCPDHQPTHHLFQMVPRRLLN